MSLKVLKSTREMLRPIISEHKGVEIKTMGDGFLVEFTLEAVNCAVEIQNTNGDRGTEDPRKDGLPLRIGIHIGDVIHSAGDVYGGAVNVATRFNSRRADTILSVRSC